MSGKKKFAFLILSLLIATAALSYYNFIYPEQRRAPYGQYGNTKQIDEFLSEYPNSNGNSTWVDFFKCWIEDSQLAEKCFNANGSGIFDNLKDALSYIYFVYNNGYDGLNFLKDHPQFAKDYQIALPVYSTNSTLFKIISDKFLRDPQITADRNSLFLNALKLYKELNLADKNLFSPTINALNNVTIANEQLNLPKLDKNTLWLLANCTQKQEGKYLVDFSPLIFKSVNSSDVYLIPNSARETWLTAKTLKLISQTFNIKNHPEMLLGLNGKIIANAWSIFDNPYGIKYYEKNLTASDKRILDLILLQWNLYSQFAPQLGGEDKLYNRDFPWYNSTELTKLYPDKNELRIALFKLFYLPAATYSIKDDKIIAGIEGAKIDLLQDYDEYKKIASGFYNSKIYETYKPGYQQWLTDRFANGLSYTVGQFLGFTDNDIHNLEIALNKSRSGEDWYAYKNLFLKLMKERNGLDQFLTKNWKYWDLVKFIVGYERWNPKVGESEGIQYTIPGVLRMTGFPTCIIGIKPAPLGTPGGEWAISLPPYIVEETNKEFPNSNILLGPGYSFGLHSCKDGLIKERGIDLLHQKIERGILEVYERVGDNKVYLMKRD